MVVSGGLMFFHLDTGLNKTLHEWVGLVMLGAVIAHLVINWRAFGTYFKRPLAQGIMTVSAVLLALSFIPQPEAGGNPARMVMRGIGQADIETVIALSGLPLEAGLERLEAVGISAEAGVKMTALTGGDRDLQMKIIETLF